MQIMITTSLPKAMCLKTILERLNCCA